MVYMNADNNLESDGIKDFLEMSRVPNSEQVNIVVQMDRSPYYSREYGNWSNTLRFKIRNNIIPTLQNSISDLGELNMGDPNVLKDFVTWAKQNYPAENYVLVIWDHGDGWRFLSSGHLDEYTKQLYRDDYLSYVKNVELFDANTLSELSSEAEKFTKSKNLQIKNLNEVINNLTSLPTNLKKKVNNNTDFNKMIFDYRDFMFDSINYIQNSELKYIKKFESKLDSILKYEAIVKNIENKKRRLNNFDSSNTYSTFMLIDNNDNPVKAVSHDDTDKDQLFNREVQEILSPKEVSIIGFDACLMSMLEVGYALKDKANYLVGSEELEPGTGWNYKILLNQLILNPSMSDYELSRVIVESYRQHYNTFDGVTLSAIDLSLTQNICVKLSLLSVLLINNVDNEYLNVKKAREKCYKFAANVSEIHSIDLSLFLFHLSNFSTNHSIKEECKQLRDELNKLVINNFCSEDMTFKQDEICYGSFGIAIYFPERKEYFDDAYKDENIIFPVQFVSDFSWDNFLLTYYQQ